MDTSVSMDSDYNYGNIIYGLGAIRDKYIQDVPEFTRARTEKTLFGYESYFIDFYMPESSVKNNFTIPRQVQFTESILKHPKYRSIIKRNNGWSLTKIGRKCKAGLHWATEDEINVHFLLDGIDMDKVISKKIILSDSEHINFKSVTGSELRWVYRNRHDEKVQKNINFWKDGARTDPPWVSNRLLWDTYRPKSEALALRGEPIALRTTQHADKAARLIYEGEDSLWLSSGFL